MRHLFVVLSLFLAAHALDVVLDGAVDHESDVLDVSVRHDGARYVVVPGTCEADAAACGHYESTLAERGWTLLRVKTNGAYADSVQMAAAGVAEGFCEWEGVWDHKANMEAWYFTHYVENGTATQWPPKLVAYLEKNADWVAAQVAGSPGDAYWQHVGLVLSQLDGVVAGYNLAAPASKQLSHTDFLVYESLGDILDLAAAIEPHTRLDVSRLHPWAVQDGTGTARDHCTGLVRLLPDFSDAFFAQAAWFSYAGMHKAVKMYDFAVNNAATLSHRLTMSSYPGMIFSYDDFLVTDQRLAILETTNEVANASLYDLVTSKSVLTWVRERVAAFMADSGQSFATVFSKHNSGTYNNGWLVMDVKAFQSGVAPLPGFLTLIEQIPGYIEHADVTPQFVGQGYWPSFNIPYFKDVYNMSGYPDLAARAPDKDFWSYERCPRAQIFRRDAPRVSDMAGFQRLMRYNDFEADPLSKGDPGNAPASRYELKPAGAARRECFGAMDAKAVSVDDVVAMTFRGEGGPTHDTQPVFTWSHAPSDICGDVRRDGLPDAWDFGWIEIEWEE